LDGDTDRESLLTTQEVNNEEALIKEEVNLTTPRIEE
jgi:hypothetical protein